MSTKTRRLVVAATVFAWTIWLSLYTLSKTGEPSIVHLVGLQASQMAAGMLTVAAVLGFLVTPVIATARIWREIGIKEQQRHCDVCPVSARRTVEIADVIPFKPARLGHRSARLERADN